jgi:SAM-dependent methyltransferase
MVTYDDELREHNERLRAATRIRPGDRVLDIGCGAGQTTRDAARAAAPGDVLGIDVSEPALARARQLTVAEGLDNVTYEQADAQVHAFAPDRFDVAISRFGVMFFADPVAAFTNIARALRPEGRLVALVWQRREDQEWAVAIDDALRASTWDESPFSLGDPAATRRLLADAGFHDIRFDDVDEPVYYGADVTEALEWVGGFLDVSTVLARLDPAARNVALGRVRDALGAHHSADRGVVFDSRAWLVSALSTPRGTARRSPPSSTAAG